MNTVQLFILSSELLIESAMEKMYLLNLIISSIHIDMN